MAAASATIVNAVRKPAMPVVLGVIAYPFGRFRYRSARVYGAGGPIELIKPLCCAF